MKELLLLAAKAADYVIVGEVDAMVAQPGETKAGGFVIRNDSGGDSSWNPILDDGDAFRLVVKIQILVDIYFRVVSAKTYVAGSEIKVIEPCDKEGDIYDCTRRSIVSVAAKIGEQA